MGPRLCLVSILNILDDHDDHLKSCSMCQEMALLSHDLSYKQRSLTDAPGLLAVCSLTPHHEKGQALSLAIHIHTFSMIAGLAWQCQVWVTKKMRPCCKWRLAYTSWLTAFSLWASLTILEGSCHRWECIPENLLDICVIGLQWHSCAWIGRPLGWRHQSLPSELPWSAVLPQASCFAPAFFAGAPPGSCPDLTLQHNNVSLAFVWQESDLLLAKGSNALSSTVAFLLPDRIDGI